MYKILPILCLCVVLLPGCNRQKSPPGLCAVSGKITLEGVPLEMGTIALVPTEKNAAKSGEGRQTPIKNGTYAFNETQALKPGSYTVRITSFKEFDRRTKGEVTPQTEDQYIARTQLVPAQYNTKSEITVELTEKGPNVFNYDIEEAATK